MNRTFLFILVAAIAALSVTFATTSISFADGNDDSSSAEVPPGQLTRKGISGVVASAGGGEIRVATRHGIVTVAVTSGTRITTQGGGAISLGDIQDGDRVGIQLNRPPIDPDAPPPPPDDGGGTSTTTDQTLPPEEPEDGDNGSATSTDEFNETDEERGARIRSRFIFEDLTIIRDVSATRIRVVPNKAATKHVRGLVTGKANGKFQLICGSGNTSDDDAGGDDGSTVGSSDGIGDNGSATSTDSNLDEQDVDIGGDVDADVGDEIILIADADEETGDGGCPTRAKGGQNSDRIAERLAALAEKTGARDSRLAARIADLEAKRAERQEARADKTRGNASPEGKGKIDGARGKPVGDDAVPRGGGSSNAGGGGNSNAGGSGNSNAGGGNSNGNQGGGRPDTLTFGPDEPGT